MDILKTNIHYFSSDYISNTLAYTDTNGTIYFGENTIDFDTKKKYLKFYPVDDSVFTTTDCLGLKVWDAHKGEIIFKYKEEELFVHSYSNKCILATFDEYNIKLFNLKMRYSIKSLQKGSIKQLGWCGEYLYVLADNFVYEYDSRNFDSRPVQKINGIKELAFTGENVFGLSIKDKQLICLKRNENDSFSYKKCEYEKIVGCKPRNSLAGLCNGKIFIEEYDKIWSLPENHSVKSLEAMYINDNNGYCIADDSIIKLSL